MVIAQRSTPKSDCVVVGASFAGIACASVLARRGASVVLMERKSDAGEKLHTTGIIVREAAEQSSILAGLPGHLVRRVPGVRLYAPNLRYVDLAAPGYYFLATDTPGVMRWLAERAGRAGVRMEYRSVFAGATRTPEGFDLGALGSTRYLVGADGPNSSVAKAFALGRNRHMLFGVEHEYAGSGIDEPGVLHCFVDRRLAPGYIGWIVEGPRSLQVGLAQRMRGGRQPAVEAMAGFLRKIAPIVDLRARRPDSIRAGMIPCGGVVSPVASDRVLLTGDAAGLVSPVTAGGIHTALKHGEAAGHAIADFLAGARPDPGLWLPGSYPRFRVKRLLRFLFDRFQSDALANLFLDTRLVRSAASVVYFHRHDAGRRHGL